MQSRSVLLKAWLFALIATAGAATVAGAVVIRPDRPDSAHRVGEDYFPGLADLPGEGHAVLVDRCWLVTAGHAVANLPEPLREVTLAGQRRKVESVVFHPGWRRPVLTMKGDAAPMMKALRSLPDIALVRLARPVDDVTPARIYRQADEAGQVVEIVGRGATGTGATGESEHASHRGALRRAANRISSVEPGWIVYRFDGGPRALNDEGIQGAGDSGGPVALRTASGWRLLGLTSWRDWRGDLSGYKGGVFGQRAYNVRLSTYAEWIDKAIGSARPCAD